MNIQELVPDLSICQEAQKKGVEIESNFWWENITGEYRVSSLPSYQGWMNGIKTFDNCLQDLIESGDSNVCPAPLTDEILEKLPVEIEKDGQVFRLTIWINKNDYAVFYGGENFCLIEEKDKKLSNALLRLVIKLKKEGLL